jgi:hypothetical protein
VNRKFYLCARVEWIGIVLLKTKIGWNKQYIGAKLHFYLLNLSSLGNVKKSVYRFLEVSEYFLIVLSWIIASRLGLVYVIKKLKGTNRKIKWIVVISVIMTGPIEKIIFNLNW